MFQSNRQNIANSILHQKMTSFTSLFLLGANGLRIEAVTARLVIALTITYQTYKKEEKKRKKGLHTATLTGQQS